MKDNIYFLNTFEEHIKNSTKKEKDQNTNNNSSSSNSLLDIPLSFLYSIFIHKYIKQLNFYLKGIILYGKGGKY